MTPEDVRLILNGWRENDSQLVLTGQLWGFALALRCRIEIVTDETVGLSTLDRGRIIVSICEEGTDFKYGEPREFPGLAERLNLTTEQRLASSLTMLFPSRSEEDDPESLCLIELIE
jgi:hypothetical protein